MSQNETRSKYEELISQCDGLIKAGKIGTVSALIAKLNMARVPRAYRQALAKICRRSHLLEQGLRLLHPIIRNEQQQIDPATPGEICEYSVLLSRIGSIKEAIQLLSKVDPAKAPEAMLYLGFCNISAWDYARAEGYLEKYLDSKADNYSKLIARVNLGSCYLTLEKSELAEKHLTETIAIATEMGASRLIGNLLEMRAQGKLHSRDFQGARTDLDQALKIFGDGQSYDQMMIFKWQQIIMALENEALAPIDRLRAEALRRKEWECLREADLFSQQIKFDQRTFDHLIVGTASPSYRARIRKSLPHEPSASFVWGDAGGMILDLRTGHMNGTEDLNPGKKIHQVLSTLSKDFYSPQSMGVLYADLYPDEYFDIDTSPTRVRQLLKRTRRWLEEHGISATIEQLKGRYRLRFHGGFGIEVPLERNPIAANGAKWEELKRLFDQGKFKADDACEKLGLSRSSFHRLAEWAIAEGKLEKTGTGRATRYKKTA